jgi:hypothetical protein
MHLQKKIVEEQSLRHSIEEQLQLLPPRMNLSAACRIFGYGGPSNVSGGFCRKKTTISVGGRLVTGGVVNPGFLESLK